jgi:hypothetical protein
MTPTPIPPTPATIDVTGLSPEAVRVVESLVGLLRANGTHRSPNQVDPEKWSAELRAWAASHPKRDITMDDSRESIYGE